MPDTFGSLIFCIITPEEIVPASAIAIGVGRGGFFLECSDFFWDIL